MEVEKFDEAEQIIIDAVKSSEISEERLNDAVTRIIKVKKEEGLFEDPFLEKTETKQKETGSLEYRKVAEKLVEESLVLLKNDSDVLPLKEGTKVYITGPAADDASAQCGDWTIEWNGSSDKEISEGKGISDVLCGCSDFTGKLPSPWYGSIDQIGTDESFLERGYGLSYGNGFQPKKEPEAISH